MKVKTKTTDADWRETLRDIESIVPRDYIEKLSHDTLQEAAANIKGKAIVSYSAGKDSIVLEHLLRPMGIPCIMAYCDLEYPMFMEWVRENAPTNLTLINSGQDLKWLAKNEDMLFPDSSAKAGRWYDIVQHKVQNKYIKEHNIKHLILGRRIADGNFCGKNGHYMKGECDVYSVLYRWRHEDILAYIHYNKLPLPPIYDLPDGYKQGTHNWASFILYDGMTKEEALERLWGIDKNIILGAKDEVPFIERWYNEHRESLTV